MSYRKIRRTSFLGNIERSLTLRQQYAKIMLGLLAENKRILNIDESTLPFCNYKHSKWGFKGHKNTISSKDLQAKVNMIAAVDTLGNVYVALT